MNRLTLPTFAALFSLLATALCSAPKTGAQAMVMTRAIRPFSAVAVDAHIGINGLGFDVATPLARHLNIRAGGDFFSYNTNFTEEGANVGAMLQLSSAHANLDWFPFHNGLHVSPLVVLANNNHGRATVLVPGGSNINLNGQNYISSLTDPLHGSGSVDFRKTSPGLTLGWGNIIPRSRKRFSFPVELGFYYVGQPNLKIAFTGSACDPSVPAALGCESVDDDASFQKDLSAFRSRNENNLSYFSFFPLLSFGLGYRF